MKYLYASNYLYINECAVDGFLLFGIDKNCATKIIKIRSQDQMGFKDIEDLKKKLENDEFELLKNLNIMF